MRPQWWRFLSKPAHRLVVVFAVFVLLPGVVLGVFALRTLVQEQVIAQQQIQRRLENIADQVGRDLSRQTREWREYLFSVAAGKAPGPDSLPAVIRKAAAAPGSGIVV